MTQEEGSRGRRGCGGTLSPSPVQRGPRRASLGTPAPAGAQAGSPGPVKHAHTRVSRAPGKVPGTCLATCMSLVFHLHQLHPQPLKREKGGWEPHVRGLQTLRRGLVGFPRVPCIPGGKDELGGGKMGKVSVAVWATAAGRDRGVYGRRKVQLVGGEWADAEDFSVLLCGMGLGTSLLLHGGCGPCLAQRELLGDTSCAPSSRRRAQPGCSGCSDPARPPSAPPHVPPGDTHCTRLQGEPGAWAIASTHSLVGWTPSPSHLPTPPGPGAVLGGGTVW